MFRPEPAGEGRPVHHWRLDMSDDDREEPGPGLPPPPIPPAAHPNPASEEEVREADDDAERRLENA